MRGVKYSIETTPSYIVEKLTINGITKTKESIVENGLIQNDLDFYEQFLDEDGFEPEDIDQIEELFDLSLFAADMAELAGLF